MKKQTKSYVGTDVHKNSVMVAVLSDGERELAILCHQLPRETASQSYETHLG